MSLFVAITDYDGHTVHLAATRVVLIRDADPARVHDHGSVTLDDGTIISFRSDSGPTQLRQELEALHAEASREADRRGATWNSPPAGGVSETHGGD